LAFERELDVNNTRDLSGVLHCNSTFAHWYIRLNARASTGYGSRHHRFHFSADSILRTGHEQNIAL
jgi:hypothetical protein